MSEFQTLTDDELILMDMVEPQTVNWIWKPFIPRGKLTIIQGDPGEGKSMLALALCAALSNGVDPEGNPVPDTPRPVLYLNAEDGIADTVKPRLMAFHANCNLIVSIDDSKSPLSLIDGRIVELVRRWKPAAVVFDPLQAYLGDEIDMHRANEIRPAMASLAKLAEQGNCAVILIGHMNKMSGKKSVYRGLGSIDITAAARSVLLVARDPDHPQNRVIAQIKNSLHEMAPPVAFTLAEDGSFRYLSEYDITVDNLLAEREASRERPQDKATELLKTWLTQYPEIAARELYLMAEGEGISKRTLIRAKQMLHIRSEQKPGGWYWSLPKVGVIEDLVPADGRGACQPGSGRAGNVTPTDDQSRQTFPKPPQGGGLS